MIKQDLTHKLSHTISQDHLKFIGLIELNTLELEQEIEKQIAENPALEEDLLSEKENGEEDFQNQELHNEDTEFIEADDINIDAYLSDDEIPNYRVNIGSSKSDENFNKEVTFNRNYSLSEHLKEQIILFSLVEYDRLLMMYLIDCLDSNGYLRQSFEDIIEDLSFSMRLDVNTCKLEEILSKIQQLTPVGVGARDLQECILLQLKRKVASPDCGLAIKIIQNDFDLFVSKQFVVLRNKYQCEESLFKDAVCLIQKLNPKPGNLYLDMGLKLIGSIEPDFEVKIIENQIEVILLQGNIPALRPNKHYVSMIDDFNNRVRKTNLHTEEAVVFAKQKLDSAMWFINLLKQRQSTLYLTMCAIAEIQKEYFLTGDIRKMKPMILKDVANRIQMDISTVSRIVNSKYVITPYGIKLLKELFSQAVVGCNGESISTMAIKDALKEIVDSEDKKEPLNDRSLSEKLKEYNYFISTRTVAKYRKQLNIHIARLRKGF